VAYWKADLLVSGMKSALSVHLQPNQGIQRPTNRRSTAGAVVRSLLLAAVTCSALLISNESAHPIDRGPAGRFVTDVWQTEQGLPQNSVSAICQTRNGYLWLGTYSGLVRFDGVRFTVFEPGNTPGLVGNRITALMQDLAGDLWIGTESGLSLLKQGQFSSYTTRDGLPNNVVRSICQDREQTIWIGTDEGLGRLSGATITPFDFGGTLTSGANTFTYVDRDGAVWVASRDALFVLKTGDKSIHRVGAITGSSVTAICKTADSSLWIATSDHLQRLKQGAWKNYGKEAGLLSDVVMALFEGPDGNLWIGTDFGLNCLSGENIRTYTVKDGLSAASIKSIAEGSEGDLWIGTDGGGLDRWKHSRITSYTEQQGLPESSIVPVLQDREGNIWLGATCGGLFRFGNGTVTRFGKPDGLPNECVWSLAEDRDGSIWIGTFNGGLTRFSNGRFVAYGEKEGLPGMVVFSLYPDRAGRLWIGTDHGLAVLKDGRIATTFTVQDGLVNDNIKFITEDRSGALWIATAGGLSCLKGGTFINYTSKDGLSYDSVRAIHADSDGTLWIGTYGGGLSRLKDGKFTRYTTREGLLDNTVSRILEDDRGNLWMNGNNGISRVSKSELNDFAEGARKSVSAITYGVADGMKSREGNGGGQPAGWRSRDGKMWFPTIRGLVSVDPNEDYGPPPPLLLERSLVNGNLVDLAKEADIGPGATEIEFHYTALSFQNPARVQFKYMLEGYDKDWVPAGTRRAAYYTNLEPGMYRFRVIASNSEGVWNETGASARFRLKPHFYRTKLFYGLSILAVVFAASALYRGRVRKLKTRAEELSMLVDQRTRAEAALRETNRYLEETLDKLHKAQQQIIQQERLRALGQMASGVAHDFNNALAPILGYSELLLVSPSVLEDKEKVIKELRIINTAAKDAASVVRGLREFFRHRKEGETLIPVKLRKVIAQAISLSQPRWRNEARARGVTITIKTDLEPVPNVPGDEAELREALINLIFNAVDAMPAGGTILFRTLADGDHVAVLVSDTGIGMSDEVRRRCLEPFFTTKGERGTGLGLASVYGTIQRHKGTIEVESQPGTGTTFKIRLPVHSTAEGAAETQQPTQPPHSLHVLLVDDEPQVRELLVEYLALDGHTAETAANGSEGVEKFRSGGFDLVVTDMAMPEMSGDQLSEAIEKIDPGIPVIMLTGFGEIMNAEGRTHQGTTLVVSKPITLYGFREAVAKAMRQANHPKHEKAQDPV
jgi:ligand-binding sensor domain-containing protein/signal transduction histidine kinase/ActR/RegA family two-component response regulator